MKLIISIVLLFWNLFVFAQTDNVGSGRAISFNGLNNYVQIGSHYHDLNLPISASAWINFDPSSTSLFPIFVTNDNTNFTYRGFEFFASKTEIAGQIGDGQGGNNSIYRRGVEAVFSDVSGRWVHMCVVMRSPTDASLYLNGIELGGFSIGDSDLPMAPSFSTDTAKIGSLYSNAGVIYRSKAQLDEVTVWNRALTTSEVRQNMCKKLSGNEPGLVGYWNFNETSGSTVYDKSPTGFNGQLINNPTRVFSGAPVGDDSKYQYSSNWSGTTFSFQDNNDLVSVNNIQGNPEGMHIYEVKNPPSQTNGLGASASTQPYYGIFAAALDPDNYFDATYSYQGSNSCSMFSRADNSVATWLNVITPSIGNSMRTEILRDHLSGSNAVFDLGPNKILCNQTSDLISTGVTDPQFSFTWNTGETTPSITVAQSGKYSVSVTGPCGTVKDSVQISFEPIPPSFELGSDRILCNQLSTTISTGISDPQVAILWSTGETTSSIVATKAAKYVVKASNDCGLVKDSLQISFEPIPPSFDLGSDRILCDQSSTTLSIVVSDPQVPILWSTGETTSSIVVTKSAKYIVKASNDCGVVKDSILIKFEPIPPPISLGDNQISCEFAPVVLKAVNTSEGYQIKWQDNSNDISLRVNDFGKYWVSVENDCGSTSDTIIFTQYKKQIDFLPNVITPNGDGLNQYFKVDDDIKGKVTLLVLNRWGKEVYRSLSYENDWDGGSLSPGEYYIVLTGPCFGEIRDSLTIIR